MLKTRVAGKEDHLPPRILDNTRIDTMDRLLPLWLVLSLAIPPAIGGLVTHSWHGALTAFLWGSAARIFFVHHVTWSINSICHIYGSQPFKTDDLSRNNPIFGILAFGEGWHNAHHAFLRSPKHGLLRWQIDPSWILIKTAERLGIVWDLALPTDQQVQRALAR
jgi:stearoyl-CoA desaturase (delta-9 desaturase)